MANIQAQVGAALVDFASNGTFPVDDAVAGAQVEASGLPAAYKALDAAKLDLEAEIRTISRDTAPVVETWMAEAQALQADIEDLRKFAAEIVREAEVDEERINGLQDQETHLAFLEKESAFNSHLFDVLQTIKQINDQLDRAESLASKAQVLEPLQLLADSWAAMDKIPVEKNTRVIRLLDTRCFELRGLIHEQFLPIWRALVNINSDEASFTIRSHMEGQSTTLDQSVIILQSYKELDETAKKLWEDIDDIILKPRMDLRRNILFSVDIDSNSLTISKTKADTNIRPLFRDLKAMIEMFNRNLPSDFVKPFALAMMPTLAKRITDDWLDKAVPASLNDMLEYQKTLAQVHDFRETLESLQWPGLDALDDWIDNAPKIWLSKRRETALDWTRNQLSLGIGEPIFAQHTESRMVARDEGLHMAASGNVVTQEWDAAWDSDEDQQEKAEDVPGRNRQSIEEEERLSAVTPPIESPIDEEDAWGLTEDDEPESRPDLDRKITPETKEVTLSEAYYTSSMPKPLFDIILSIYNDGVRLTKPESEEIPVAPAAAGLFGLPIQVLAMYRAVSPFHYSRNPSGNMFMYNDSMWLCDRLKEFAAEWAQRTDLAPRAYGMVKLDLEVRVLQSFGKRAYTNEMVSQRTIINDMMGGAQNFLQDPLEQELEQGIQTVVSHIRDTSARWKKILPYSAWASAVGSLVNAVAAKIIFDVFDLSSMDVDAAARTAQLITTVSGLDNLFIRDEPTRNGKSVKRSGTTDEEGETAIPLTPQFADKWIKMKFLSEVLQANLPDIRYLWFQSDLSLYFTKEEAEDLIRLSFEDNVNVRQLIREIKQSNLPAE